MPPKMQTELGGRLTICPDGINVFPGKGEILLNRTQSAAARQLLLTTYLLSVGGRAKDEKALRERLPPYESVYEASLKEKGDKKAAAAALRQQLIRDMDALAHAGVDVEVEASRVWGEEGATERRHYRLPPDGFSPVELDLSEGERAVLVNALRSAGRGFAYSAPLHLALANLVGLAEGNGGSLASAKSSREDEAISKRVADLDKAISRRKRVRFDYERISGDETSSCEIEPYILSLLDETWYVTGRTPEDGSVGQLKVSRIRSRIVNATKKDRGDFEMPDGFDRLFAGPQAPWQLGKTGEWAHIHFSSGKTWRKMSRYRWSGTMGSYEGHRTFMTRYANVRSLAGWTLSLGDGAKALAPEPVVEEVVAGLEKIAAAHRGSRS